MTHVERIATILGRPEDEVSEKLEAAVTKATTPAAITKANIRYEIQVPECPPDTDNVEHFIEHVAPQYQKMSAAKQFNYTELAAGMRLSNILHSALMKSPI